MPPRSNAIAARQADAHAQRLQAAARKEYDHAILLRRIKTSVNFALAVVGPILVLVHPKAGVLLGTLAVGWLFFSKYTIDPYATRRIQRGALTLEEFDCYVYELPWNYALGESLATEEIIDSAARSTHDDGAWYPDVAQADRATAILICQRSNVVWSRRQHSIYAVIVSLAAWIWLAVGIIITLFSSADLAAYLLTVAFPSAPAFLDAIEIRNANSETAERRRELEITLDKAIAHPTRKTFSEGFLRSIQDQIFGFRATSPLIPKIVYRWLKSTFNANMQEAARRQIEGDLMLTKDTLLSRYEISLRPAARDLSAARTYAAKVIKAVMTDVNIPKEIVDCRIMGSVERGTALKPIKDVDILVVFKDISISSMQSTEFLQEASNCLSGIFPELSINIESCDIHLIPDPESPSFELVPALIRPSGGYRIAGPSDTWVVTDPPAKARYTETRDSLMKGTFRPLVRILKHWRDVLNVPINSWHLEAMAGHLTEQPVQCYEVAVAEFFGSGPSLVDIVDPDGVGGSFSMSSNAVARSEYDELLATSMSIAQLAIAAAEAGQHDLSVDLWSRIMGAELIEFSQTYSQRKS